MLHNNVLDATNIIISRKISFLPINYLLLSKSNFMEDYFRNEGFKVNFEIIIDDEILYSLYIREGTISVLSLDFVPTLQFDPCG